MAISANEHACDQARSGLDGPLAQLVEQLTLNQRVTGSIPVRPTKYLKNIN